MIDTLRRYIQGECSSAEEKQLTNWLHDPANKKDIQSLYEQLWKESPNEFPADVRQRVWKKIKHHPQYKINIPNHSTDTHHKLKLYVRTIAATAAAIILAVLSFKYGAFLQESQISQGEMIERYVPYGQRERVTLPDGSTAWLNSGSVLIYPREFKGSTRSVYLSGEGNFNVQKNPQKAFIVRTKHLDVEALGTTFCVESYPGAAQTSATLEQGSIRVNYTMVQNTPTLLIPGQRLVYDHTSKKIQLTTVDAHLYASWIDGSLVFKDESFDRIIARLERQYNVTINYPLDKYQGKRFFLRFVSNESLEQILSVFSSTAGGFRYSIRGSEVSIR